MKKPYVIPTKLIEARRFIFDGDANACVYVLFVYNNKFIQSFLSKEIIDLVNLMYKLRRLRWNIK